MKTKLRLDNLALSYLIYFGILFYVFLAILNLISMRPLWLDENLLFKNFKELKPLEIFGPLKYSQGFPRLYLYIIQNISRIFNYHVLSLRILPFIFMLTGFGIWLKVFRLEEGKGIRYLLFILCWCGSIFMTYYSAEFKQYSADVFSAGVFTYIILKQKESLRFANYRFSLVLQYIFLPVLLLFSYTAYFFIFFPGYNLLLNIKNEKNNLLYFSIYLLSAIVFFCLSYNIDIKYTITSGCLRDYWKDYFISTASFYDFMKTFWEGLRNILTRWFLQDKIVRRIISIFIPSSLYFVIFFGSKQFKKDKWIVTSLSSLALFLFISLFISGILNIYPFTGARVTLFIAPFIFYAIIKGIEMFKAKLFVIYAALLTVFTLFSVSIYLFNSYLHKLLI